MLSMTDVDRPLKQDIASFSTFDDTRIVVAANAGFDGLRCGGARQGQKAALGRSRRPEGRAESGHSMLPRRARGVRDPVRVGGAPGRICLGDGMELPPAHNRVVHLRPKTLIPVGRLGAHRGPHRPYFTGVLAPCGSSLRAATYSFFPFPFSCLVVDLSNLSEWLDDFDSPLSASRPRSARRV